MNFEIEYIEKLAQILKEQSLTEICLENGENAITLRKESVVAQTITTTPNVPQALNTPAPVQEPAQPTESTNISKKGTPITSPMVGTFYSASSPDAPAFVKVGDTITAGKVVCIIEAMKLMNEIESEISGKITEICVKNGDPVEFGQVLMYVE